MKEKWIKRGIFVWSGDDVVFEECENGNVVCGCDPDVNNLKTTTGCEFFIMDIDKYEKRNL